MLLDYTFYEIALVLVGAAFATSLVAVLSTEAPASEEIVRQAAHPRTYDLRPQPRKTYV